MQLSNIWLRLYSAFRTHLDIFRQDVRYTLRTFTRSAGFTITAILVTGLGIGANTAAFTVTDHVMLRPLPFADPDRLVSLWQTSPGYMQVELSPPNFYDWRRLNTSFEAMAAYSGDAANFLGQGDPQRLEGTRATADFFRILGVKPLLGRAFTDEDGSQAEPRNIILSYAFWQSTFGADREVVGKTIRLDNAVWTIVGVMPQDFFFPARGTQFWRPMLLANMTRDARDNLFLNALGKLKPGIGISQARAEMKTIAQQLGREYPKENEKVGADIFPLADQLNSQTRMLLWALFGASVCVLLIASANLANLLLAKAMARRKELTVRAALGAGRERLVRQLLTESLLLTLAGGLAGILFAVIALPLLQQLIPARLPLADATVLDRRVFGFAALVTFATGIVFGVLPAFRMCRGMDHEGLREGSRAGIGGRREVMRSVLVVAEITAAIVLVSSAGLLIQALLRVKSVDPGFRTDSVLAVQEYLPPRYGSNSRRAAFYSEVLSEVRAMPGVSQAAFASFLPMAAGVGGIWPIVVSGGVGSSDGAALTSAMRVVSPAYFETIGTPLKAGRDVAESDSVDSPPVAVVSESFARRYWPNESAVGHTFHFALNGFPFAEQERTIVGVVGDIRFRGLERRSEPQVYLAYHQLPDNTATYYAPRLLVVRSSIDAASLAPSVRKIVRKADPEIPITSVQTLKEVVDLQTAPRTTQIQLVAMFAGLSLLLAGVGIHGLLSFAVGQRSPEFGVRIALGAQSRDILTIVLREGILLGGIGVTAGLVLSYLAGRSMQALLAGVSPFDPLTVLVASVVALAMTISGSLLPALRAMRTDPTTVMRAG